MKHLFLNKELSQLAKEKGFDEPCLAYHRDMLGTDEKIFFILGSNKGTIRNSQTIDNIHKMVAAPLCQQIIDWFFDKHSLVLEIDFKYPFNLRYRIYEMQHPKLLLKERYSCASGLSFKEIEQVKTWLLEEAFKLI